MKIESIDISKLSLDPSNARRHDEKNLAAIVGSLKKFGQQKPLVIGADDVVVAGNGTLEAAKEIGWAKVDCVRTKLRGAEAIAYALADNRTTDLSVWDDEVLGKQLQALYEDDFAIEDIGFTLEDITGKLGKEGEGAKELSEDDFSEFDHTCPKCGFEFDNKPA